MMFIRILASVLYQNIDNPDSEYSVDSCCHEACDNIGPNGGVLYMLHAQSAFLVRGLESCTNLA